MGDLWVPDAADWLIDAGLVCHIYPGALTRSRSSGGFDDILGIGGHHDASAIGRSGASAARAHFELHQFAPVGNFALDRGGEWWFGAAGASNTQGKGGPYPTSRAITPLDAANRYWLAVEAANNGVGEPWPEDQQRSYVLGLAALARGLAEQGAYDARRRRYRTIWLDPATDVGIAHFEWAPTRKIDPAGPSRWDNPADRYRRWQMDAFRADVTAALTAHEEDPDMTTVRYFTLAKQPATLWATSDGLHAIRVELSVAQARGIDFKSVPVLDEAEARRMIYGHGLTVESVR